MRHAETEWNREKRVQGQQDAPLTSSGRQQA
ncbi:MAG: histidine phosphatase family protein, partial [Deltaproteobacteria bacterium]|nr:histidine phosphatase family protein [Deltaproteobacteria bacterium]